MPHNNILLFDGVCNLCNGVVQFIIRNDKEGKIKFGALQSEAGQELLRKYGLPVKEFESFVFIQDNKTYQKSDAALLVAKTMGGVWKLFYGFIIIPKFIRDSIYELVSNSRYKIFGRRDSCMVPTQELRERFLE